MKTSEHITGFILAGGKSSRMGTEKGLLPLGDDSITGHILKTMKSVFTDVRIISDNTEYKHFGVPVLSDEIKNCGPAGGILTGLRHSQTKFNFFIGCDMPFVNRKILLMLMAKSEEGKITVPVLQGKPEPLCGIYPTSINQQWERLVTEGCFTMHKLISFFSLNKVNMIHNPEEDYFYNINTPEEYQYSKNKYLNR